MSNLQNREEHAFAYFRQAATDRDFAVAAYGQLARGEVNGRTDFFCCIIAHCQQAIEKAVKGFLIGYGATFPFTHQIIDWVFHTRGQKKYKRFLQRRLQPMILTAAMRVEQFAPTPETKLNTEYPYLARSVDGHEVWQAPAEGFTEIEVVQALRAARIVVAVIIMAPPV
ncbi:HEPN domain-containing protein [Candidatus Poribacteria bacterium]|nr:HEPN domain-containing protein [Candidatus Poribacteria bacterium]